MIALWCFTLFHSKVITTSLGTWQIRGGGVFEGSLIPQYKLCNKKCLDKFLYLWLNWAWKPPLLHNLIVQHYLTNTSKWIFSFGFLKYLFTILYFNTHQNVLTHSHKHEYRHKKRLHTLTQTRIQTQKTSTRTHRDTSTDTKNLLPSKTQHTFLFRL